MNWMIAAALTLQSCQAAVRTRPIRAKRISATLRKPTTRSRFFAEGIAAPSLTFGRLAWIEVSRRAIELVIEAWIEATNSRLTSASCWFEVVMA